MIRIDPEFKSLIPPLTDEEYEGLRDSILHEGCRDALVIWDGVLIDGHNRYEICEKYGIPYDTVEMEFANRDEAKLWIYTNQLSRRNLLAYQRAVIALEMKSFFAEKAKENQRGGQGGILLSQKSVEAKSVDTQKELAKVAGVSHDTIAKVEKIEAKATPEVKEQLRKGGMSINQAYKDIKREEKRQEREEIIQQQIEKPSSDGYVDIYTTDKLYRVIYADPPWSYNDKQNVEVLGGAEKHYLTMPLQDICDLPVPSADNAVLFIWVTSPLLEDVFKVIKAWGFKYKSSFVWDKVAHNMGHYNSVRHEFLLIATKGSCTPDVQKLYDSVVSIERTEHSRKPKEFRDMIDTLYPYGDRLELFAREAPKGWDVWGNMA